MATSRKSSTPSFFNFLKEGLLLPTHSLRLFAAVFALTVASSSLLLLGNYLVAVQRLQPLADEIRLDSAALNSTDPSSPEYPHLLQEILYNSRDLLLTGAAYCLVTVIIGSAVSIVVHFAAVATYSGELHTFGSLLGKAKAQLKGPVLTLAFLYALEIACLALFLATGVLLSVFLIKQYLALPVVLSLLLVDVVASSAYLVCLLFVWPLSVVVAVAEPGCHGAGAVARAWRLMKGKRWRNVLFILVTGVLDAALSPVYTLARTCALSNVASGLLLGFLYTMLAAAVGIFATCAMTAFYYECKESAEVVSVKEYIMVSTKEQLDV